MIPELGQLALALALGVALLQGTLPFLGATVVARSGAQAQALLIAFAFGCLVYAFVTNDFSVQYVALNSNSALPLEYRIAGAWGGHEGSLLLWCLMLGVWMAAVSYFSSHLPEDMVARVLGVMGLVSAGFLAFLLFTSNPFDRLFPVPADGRDLNPLLQDPGMVFHPPMLYMGYVGFSVAYAFAVAALIAGRLDAAWARWSRPWTTVAWVFLTLGIALGSAWAYYELGWGGWWFWDPVENASFMPWLVGTALIHSLAVTEKRGGFRSWTVLLAIVAFGLSLLGTFLVRSGVLTSVHAFAVDPKRGVFILMLFTLFIGGALGLYAWRTGRIGLGGAFAPVSRESLLLANNVLLAAATGTVFLGTMYPLAIDALGAGNIALRLFYLLAQRVDGLFHVGQCRQLELVDLVHRVINVLERALQRLQRNGRAGRLLMDRSSLGAEHLAGGVDHVGGSGVERADLLQHQLLVGHRLGDCDGSAQRGHRGCRGTVDALHQLDIVLLDQVERQVALHGNRHLGQQVSGPLPRIK